MTFTLVDDGTLDTVLWCDDCGQEIRFLPEAFDELEGIDGEGLNRDRIGYAVELATDSHKCEAEEQEEAEEAPTQHVPDLTGRLILVRDGVPMIDPNVVGLSPLFTDLVDAVSCAAPYGAQVYRLCSVEES